MKIIYKYKGSIKSSDLILGPSRIDRELEQVVNNSSAIILLGKEEGSFLEYAGAFSVIAPYPEDGGILVPQPQMELQRVVSDGIQPSVFNSSFEVAEGFPEYIEIYDISGLNANGFAKLRVPLFLGLPDISPQLNRTLNETSEDTLDFVEGTQLIDFELKYYLESLDPRIKAEDVVVTPVKNLITILPDDSGPESEYNIYKYFKEDPEVKSCSVLRVLKPPGFGCTPSDLYINMADDVISEVPTLARQEEFSTSSQNLLQANLPPDYSFGVTAQYKINDGPWLTYQRLQSDEEVEEPFNGYERQPYDFCNWYDHVYDFFNALKDEDGRRLVCFYDNGGEYVPFQIRPGNWNNPNWSMYGAELNFENWDNYYPPPINFFSESEEEQVKVDPNRQTTLYFKITPDAGNLADIIGSLFEKDSEIRSCCYAYWYSQAQ